MGAPRSSALQRDGNLSTVAVPRQYHRSKGRVKQQREQTEGLVRTRGARACRPAGRRK